MSKLADELAKYPTGRRIAFTQTGWASHPWLAEELSEAATGSYTLDAWGYGRTPEDALATLEREADECDTR